jgi:HAD superfamily hydrolase (TIGR01509 family)
VRSVAVRQLVWDMDGTLLDSGRVVPAAFAAAVRQLGGPVVAPVQVVACYSLGNSEVILAHLLGRPLGAGEIDEYYAQLGRMTVRPYPAVAEVIAALHARGHAVAVFTGASKRAADVLLASAGLAVDVLVGGDQVRPKPSADGLLRMAEFLGVAPPALTYIGDSPLDLRAARAAGSHSAAAAWGHQYDATEPADHTLTTPIEALGLI